MTRGKLKMKRRTFFQSSLAAVAVASPIGRVLAAGGQAAASIPDIQAVSRTGGEVALTKAEVKEFGQSLYGQLLMPGNDGYDQARIIWNGMFDQRPGLIARCSGVSDVMNAVDFSRTHDLLVAVRGGGHSLSGKSSCNGGIMIDLSPMQGVRVDPKARTARVQAGVLINKLDQDAQRFGLVTTTGMTSHTGLAGLTLGGGFGRLGRVFGMTCDNLLSADIVTADGQYRHLSSDENPDLFWGIRGGGGNFGIVTSFEYQLHPFGPEFLAGGLLYPMSQMKDVLNFYSEFSLTAPPELSVGVVTGFPPGGKGRLVVGVTYVGDEAEGARVIQPLREFGKPARDSIGIKNYVDVQRANDRNLPFGKNYYMKSGFMTEVQPGLIDFMDGGFEPNPTRSYTAILGRMGGAISQVGESDTAFAHRDAEYNLSTGCSWKDRDHSDENAAYMRNLWKQIRPFTKGFYVNMELEESTDRVRQTYRGNYDRLLALKNEYDPTNLFHRNANIEPSV